MTFNHTFSTARDYSASGTIWRWLAGAVVLCIFLAASAGGAVEPTAGNSDQRARAAVVCRLARYVERSHQAVSDDKSPVIICVLGNDEFARTLAAVSKDKTSDGRRFEVRSLRKAGDAKGCDLLYVSKMGRADLSLVLKEVAGQPIVTVSDMDGFAQAGGMVEFAMPRGFPRFAVNLDATKTAGVSLSSRFLKFSRITGKRYSKER